MEMVNLMPGMSLVTEMTTFALVFQSLQAESKTGSLAAKAAAATTKALAKNLAAQSQPPRPKTIKPPGTVRHAHEDSARLNSIIEALKNQRSNYKMGSRWTRR